MKLEPLNPLPSQLPLDRWRELIGFMCRPASLLQGDYASISRYEILAETGLQVQLLDQPLSQYAPFYQVAHGANSDMNIPIDFWSDRASNNDNDKSAKPTFLTERGLRLRGKYDRAKSLRLTKRVLSLMNDLGPRAREWKEGPENPYDEEEPLCLLDLGQSFIWTNNWDDFIQAIDSLDPLNDDDFFNSFGRGRNGIQTRAQKLITGGHFDVGKMQTARCRIKTSNDPAIAIRMEAIPSMKSETY